VWNQLQLYPAEIRFLALQISELYPQAITRQQSSTSAIIEVKLSLCLIKHDALETWGVEVQLHTFFTSVLNGDEWSHQRSGHIIPWNGPSNIRWIGAWVYQEQIWTAYKVKLSPYRQWRPTGL
jgi:hypothetical protein